MNIKDCAEHKQGCDNSQSPYLRPGLEISHAGGQELRVFRIQCQEKDYAGQKGEKQKRQQQFCDAERLHPSPASFRRKGCADGLTPPAGFFTKPSHFFGPDRFVPPAFSVHRPGRWFAPNCAGQYRPRSIRRNQSLRFPTRFG